MPNFLSIVMPTIADLINVFGALLQIIIFSIFFYVFLRFLRGTPGFLMLSVLILIPILSGFANLFELKELQWVITGIISNLFMFLLVIFQAEIRRFMAFIAKTRLRWFRILSTRRKVHNQALIIDELVDAICLFTVNPKWFIFVEGDAENRRRMKKAPYNTGALIAIECEPRLTEFIENGVRIDAKMTSILLQTIFHKGGPLHDGGVIIRNGKIAAAACQFPQAAEADDNSPLHTRHNAATGLAQLVPDIVVIVVSEENGNVSVTNKDGTLKVMENPAELKEILYERLDTKEKPEKKKKEGKKFNIPQMVVDIIDKVVEQDDDTEKENKETQELKESLSPENNKKN